MSGPARPDALPAQYDAAVRSQVLELLVQGAPLAEVITAMLRGMERLCPGALCSLVLLDDAGQRIADVVAPNLPAFYRQALIGLAIGPAEGSCGTAAYRGERVVVEDIASHPYWTKYRDMAAQAGLAACWSQPVCSASGRVLGTFAIYYRERRAPGAADLALIQQSAALACIAIEKDAEARKLRDSEERYRTLVEWSPDPVLVHRDEVVLYVNPSAVRTFGARSAADLVGCSTRTLIHPDYLAQQTGRLQAIVRNQPIPPMVESRFLRVDGEPFDVEVQGTAISYQGAPAVQVVLRDISQRKRAEAALLESQERFRALVEFLPISIIVHQAMRVVYANPAAARTLGAATAAELLGRPILELTHPDDHAGVRERVRLREETGLQTAPIELRLLRLDGAVIDVEMNATLIQYAGASAVQSSFTDVTEHRQAKARLELAATVFSHAREGIVITDAHNHILEANHTFSAITGYGREELLGTQPALLRPGGTAEAYLGALWQGLRAQGHWSGEIGGLRRDGEAYAGMLTISAVRDAQGQLRNHVLLLVDITPLKAYQKQLENLAHFDALTHLPNRLLLADRLHQAMSQSQRRHQAVAVVFLDLDGFKAVNDQHGHAVGDTLLIALAQRMKAALRDGDTLARIGGDEFVAVLVDLPQPQDALPVLERLLLAAADTVRVGALQLQVSASMGIAVYPRDGAHADLLLRRADQSMYLAKQAGRNRYAFFHEDDAQRPLDWSGPAQPE